jgi:hypothetical protein
LFIGLVYLAAAGIVIFGGYFIAFPGELGYGVLIGMPLAGFGFILGLAAYAISSLPPSWRSGARRLFWAVWCAGLFPALFWIGAGFVVPAALLALMLVAYAALHVLLRMMGRRLRRSDSPA